MEITVIGASGGTGRQVVGQALAAGHGVTAVVRRPGAIESAAGLRVEVIADLAVAADADRVVAGRDAVISALGTSTKGPTSVCTDGVHAVLGAMQRTGVRRLVAVSAHGASDSRDRSPYSLVLWATLAAKMRDKDRMEELVRASDLDWTIVRPAALSDSPHSGRYRVGDVPRVGLSTRISRADLAEFLLREVTAPAWVHQTPTIAR